MKKLILLSAILFGCGPKEESNLERRVRENKEQMNRVNDKIEKLETKQKVDSMVKKLSPNIHSFR